MRFPLLIVSLIFASLATLIAEEPTTFDVGPFTFTRPPDWKWVAVNSPMRKAQLSVPGKDGANAADIVFFHFGTGPAGGVEANVRRWLGQFQSKAGAEKIEAKNIAGTKVTFVTTEGTYQSGMPGGPTTPLSDMALQGAILEHADGPVFVKMTGPASLVKDTSTKFIEFVTAALSAKK
jgi:hypothetical protein